MGTRGTAVHDHVALAEIELCGDLMIAASATRAERLSADRIDEILRVHDERHRRLPEERRRHRHRGTGPS
ncbi:hypothetical protein HUT18_18985 [Streptomyces sp. NA04227]|uniref:hypothetical protein n=1 Tax=Streptomyces sp. NA04227 TaxID=2742136 RepID=UPI00159245D5|nr:hypothetical protein [Streptomyces sp. NA04227]QKW10998.1 hypothetical protein HUT18_18985 [Streptomyces sp. NA04227]